MKTAPICCLLALLTGAASGSGMNIPGSNASGAVQFNPASSGAPDRVQHDKLSAADHYNGYVALANPQHFHMDLHYHGLAHQHPDLINDHPELGIDDDHHHGSHPGHHHKQGAELADHTNDTFLSSYFPQQLVPYATHEHVGHHTPKIFKKYPGPYAHYHNGTHHHHPGHEEHHHKNATEDPPCTNTRQSPINIDTCNTIRRPGNQIVLRNFQRYPATLNFTNTGKDVMGFLTWDGRAKPRISGGRMPGVFVPFAIDMHWGTNNSVGSEHTINGRRYQLEMHIQCRNVKYDTTAEAIGKVDGLAVIAVFYEVDTNRLPAQLTPQLSRGINAMAETFFKIKVLDTTAEVASPPSMRELMPTNINNYVQYEGSLTSSPFSEVVSWTVMLTPVRILDVELGLLRDLKKEGGKPIGNTYRGVQGRCGRKLYRTGVKFFDSCS